MPWIETSDMTFRCRVRKLIWIRRYRFTLSNIPCSQSILHDRQYYYVLYLIISQKQKPHKNNKHKLEWVHFLNSAHSSPQAARHPTAPLLGQSHSNCLGVARLLVALQWIVPMQHHRHPTSCHCFNSMSLQKYTCGFGSQEDWVWCWMSAIFNCIINSFEGHFPHLRGGWRNSQIYWDSDFSCRVICLTWILLIWKIKIWRISSNPLSIDTSIVCCEEWIASMEYYWALIWSYHNLLIISISWSISTKCHFTWFDSRHREEQMVDPFLLEVKFTASPLSWLDNTPFINWICFVINVPTSHFVSFLYSSNKHWHDSLFEHLFVGKLYLLEWCLDVHHFQDEDFDSVD